MIKVGPSSFSALPTSTSGVDCRDSSVLKCRRRHQPPFDMSSHTGFSMSKVLYAFSLFAMVSAQVFDLGISGVSPVVYSPPDDLSEACSATFANTINCSPTLPRIAWEGYFPTEDDLRFMCKSTCLQSLGGFRSKQLAACKSDVEIVAGETWPATYNVDYFIFTYNSTCRTDQFVFRLVSITIKY